MFPVTRVCVFSIIRLTKIISTSQTDIIWNYTALIIWSTLELAIGIICPCLVTLRPILRFVFGKFYDRSHDQINTITGGPTLSHASKNSLFGPYHRIDKFVDNDEARLAYHSTRRQESQRSESDMIPMVGIRVVKGVNVENKAADC